MFEMPNENPEKAKHAKHEWYLRNKERVLQQKRERRAALRKLKPPRPPKPAPTPEQIARAREANRLACLRYRAKHLAQVRHLNRDYDVCAARLLELNHGYARIEAAPDKAGP